MPHALLQKCVNRSAALQQDARLEGAPKRAKAGRAAPLKISHSLDTQRKEM